MAEITDKTIKLLLEKGFLKPDEAEKVQNEVIAKQLTPFDVIATNRILSGEKLTKAKSAVLNIPYIDLTDKEISHDVLEIVPEEIAKNYELCPFEREQNNVKVAMVNPNDYKAVEALDFIGRQKGVTFKYFLISPQSLKTILRQYESRAREVEDALKSSEETTPEEPTEM